MNFGGGTVKAFNFTTAWGQSAGSGSATVLGAFSLTTGQDFGVTVGGTTIYGVVKNPVEKLDTEGGLSWEVPLVDNREKLLWDTLQGSFNTVEIVEVDPAAYGAARRRRYRQILPDDWHAQIVTYTDNPLTAHEILDYIFGAGAVSFGWSFVNHARLANPVYNIDADTGSSLANLVQQVLDKLGLLMTLTGEYQLTFGVKGDGALPGYSGSNIKERGIGEALSNQAPAVRVIGDRNIYQVLHLDLGSDWKAGWEDYLFEGDWQDAVNTFYDLPTDTPSDRALNAAKARSVTVAEWVAITGDDALADTGRYGDVSRMSMPAWVYINEIVFKAYHIVKDVHGYPSPDGLNGIPLESLKIRDGLLARVSYDPDTGDLFYFTEGGEYQLYTDDKAFIIARGQPVDLSDPAKRDVLDPATMGGLREKWFVQSKFKLDPKNYTIIFDDPVFEIGEDEDEGLFIFVNAESDLPVDHPSRNLVVPNAGADIFAAYVRGSFCFEAERYHKDFGSGLRKTSNYVQGLALHELMEEGAFKAEIKYDTDPEETADQKAEKAATSFLAKTDTYASGSFTRLGSAGTTLTPSIDRASYKLDGNGLQETIDFTKERGPDYFESERELERRNLSDDLYPGMRENKQAVKDLEYLGRLLAGLQSRSQSRKYRTINDVWQTPVGNVDSAPTSIFPSIAYAAGEAIYTSEGGASSLDGKAFQGIVVCAGCAAGSLHPVATQGTVPVKVAGPCKAGDVVGVKSGEKIARVNGAKLIGVVQDTYTGTQTVTLPVRLGAGGAAPASCPYDTVVATPPAEHVGETGWVKVVLDSRLLKSILPTDKVDITALDTPFQLAVDEYVWLTVDLTPLYDEPPTDPTATVEHGPKWNPTSDIFPDPILWDTDDGTPTGSDPEEVPDNRKQTHFFVPISRTIAPDTEDNEPAGILIAPGVKLIQVLKTHLLMARTCYRGDDVFYVLPFHGWFPPPPEPEP